MSIAATFVSNTSFTIAGDCSEAFASGSRVLADCGSDGTRYGTVSSTNYASSADLTTVTLSLDWGALTANLAGVLHGNDVPASLANHGHTGQADGGELPDFIRRDNSRAFSQGFISGEGAYTDFKFTETGADVATDTGKWIFQVDDGMFSMLAVDDAESAFNSALTIDRDGAAPSAVTIAAPYVGLSADNVEAAGNLVPAASDPGSLGSATRPWADVRTDKLLGVDVSDGTVDALVSKATAAVAVAGTDTAKAVTAAAVRQAVLCWMRDSLGKFPGITPPSLNLFCGDATDDTAPAGTFTRSTTGTRLGQAGLIETVAADSPRREWDASGNLLGWLIEKSRTNVVLYSRDLTNAAWTKTNCTAALTQTGIDGAAASASLLTATANAATCLQSITLASSNRFQTAYLKRITGTGAVSMTMDGGITWTDITNSLSATTWTRVSIPVQTLANPSVGFRLATSGDAIAVDGVQNETSSYPTSNIATTSTAVARSSDVWTLPLNTSWFKTTAGTLFVVGRTPSWKGTQVVMRLDNGASTDRIEVVRYSSGTIHIVESTSGSIVADIIIGVVADLTTFRAAFSWSASGFSASLNGAACVTATAATLPSGLTTHRIGSDAAGASQWGGHILHSAYFPVALSDAQLQAITL